MTVSRLTTESLNSIQDLKDSEDFCFRGSDVGKRTSWSPQHGIAAHDSRFSGPNDLYQPLSANQFRKHYNSLYWRKAQLHDGVENHVMGGWYEDRAEFYTRAIIPWISTTCSFKWAIWEIARRLSTSRGAHSTYDLSVIKRRLYIPSAYRGSKMIGLEAEQVLQAIPTDLRNDRAINFARSSSEILWYGRIFLKDIYETTKWTVTTTPFKLPEEFYVPRKKFNQCRSESWIHRLVFDPAQDSFFEAMEKVEARRAKIASSRHK